MMPIRKVNQPNPMAKKLSDANTTSPMDMSSRSRPPSSVGPKNLDGRREFVWRDIGACRSSKDAYDWKSCRYSKRILRGYTKRRNAYRSPHGHAFAKSEKGEKELVMKRLF